MAAVIPAAVVAVQVAGPFRPDADRPYRVTQREVRSDDGVVRRFASRRTLVFRREGDGWLAELTLDALDHADDPIGRSFAASNAGLIGRTLRLHLDAGGQIVAVDDAAGAFAALVAGIERAGNGPQATRLAAAFRAMAPDAQAATIAGELSALIDAAPHPAGARAVTLPGRPPFPAAPMAGTETVVPDPAGGATVRTVAGNAGPDGAGLAVTIVRRLATNGLVTCTRIATDVRVAGAGGRMRVATIERVLTVETAP